MSVNKSLYLKGKKYISASRAAELTGYAGDYIGQLCRGKKISASLVGRSWYVLENEILDYKNKNLITHRNTLKTRRLKKNNLSIESGHQNKNIKKENKSKNRADKIVKTKQEKIESRISSIRDVIRIKPLYHNDNNALSSIRDIREIKSLYHKDNLPLFPILEKKFDIKTTKYLALDSVQKALGKPRGKSGFEKFAIGVSLLSILILLSSSLIFGGSEIKKLASFDDGIGREASLIFDSGLNKIEGGYEKLRNNITQVISEKNNFALALSSFNWNQLSGWAKDTAYKIIKPWLSDSEPVLVDKKGDRQVVVINQNASTSTLSQAKTFFVAGNDREYVDYKIAELKNWFLINPLAPNVNRYYITRQNDSIVNDINSSVSNVSSDLSDFQTSIASSFSTGDLTATGSTTVADLTATEWLTVGTTTRQDILTLDGSFYLASISIPTDTSSRLYNTNNGDLYWAGNLIGGSTTGNWTTNGTDVWRAGGNVGIGSTTPGYKLSVAGSGYFDGGSVIASVFTATSSITAPSLTLSSVATNSLLSTNASGQIVATSTPTFGNFNATSTNATSTIAGGLAIGTSKFVVDYSSGNVSINTAPSTFKLLVKDTGGAIFAGASNITITGLSTAVNHSAGMSYSGGVNSVIAGNDTRAGFHAAVTANTNSKNYYSILGLRKDSAGWASGAQVALTAGDYLPGIGFAGQSGTTDGADMEIGASILGVVDGTVSAGNLPTSLVFHTSATNDAGLTEQMRITSSGNVGIGSTTPGYKLSVAGSGYFDGGSVIASVFTATSSITAPS
ncbi:MAG: hypothetical protein M1338_01250, partial [Patescibacteria group bacterium]|nr:hypothetical protein [Patescibacteria group bacterium]